MTKGRGRSRVTAHVFRGKARGLLLRRPDIYSRGMEHLADAASVRAGSQRRRAGSHERGQCTKRRVYARARRLTSIVSNISGDWATQVGYEDGLRGRHKLPCIQVCCTRGSLCVHCVRAGRLDRSATRPGRRGGPRRTRRAHVSRRALTERRVLRIQPHGKTSRNHTSYCTHVSSSHTTRVGRARSGCNRFAHVNALQHPAHAIITAQSVHPSSTAA